MPFISVSLRLAFTTVSITLRRRRLAIGALDTRFIAPTRSLSYSSRLGSKIVVRRTSWYHVMSTSAVSAGKVDSERMRNHLTSEKSPYLLQHADNPVDWYPWGEEAFAKARKENKMIFLSIGYSTCHWCHVMAHECFENEEIAKLMNEHYVNIKVDREVQPDVDRVYMTFLQATSGGGGWPLSVFLTPELEPIFAGTYFPPEDKLGRPGFPTLLKRLALLWKEQQDDVSKSAKGALEQLREATDSAISSGTADDVNPKVANQLYHQYARQYDSKEGGFGGQPKFPTPVQLHFLLRYHYYLLYHLGIEDTLDELSVAEIRAKGSALGVDFVGCVEKKEFVERLKSIREEARHALEMVEFTLEKIARGGIHDHVGNGFHRYAVDGYWHIPHFEKMLYDQAQLLAVYTELYLITKNERHAEVARDIIAYVERDLRDPVNGGFFAAEDADSYPYEGAPKKLEGAFAVWEKREIDEILGERDAAIFNYYFGVEATGNCPPEYDHQQELVNKNVLIERHTIDETKAEFGIEAEEVRDVLVRGKKMLAEVRFSKKPRPHRDDKVLTAWNGLMISALARASQALDEYRYVELAEAAVRFLRECMYDSDRQVLLRSYREEPGTVEGFADDYSYLIQGLLDLYETTFDESHLAWAIELQDKQNEIFYDSTEGSGGYFNVRSDDKNIVLRMKEDYDGAEPSPNSVSVSNLLRLAVLSDVNSDYGVKAEMTIRTFAKRFSHVPQTMPFMVASTLAHLHGIKGIMLNGPIDDMLVKQFALEVRHRFIPNRVLFAARPESEVLSKYNESVKGTLLASNATPSAHVCENFTCGMPIHEVDQLIKQL